MADGAVAEELGQAVAGIGARRWAPDGGAGDGSAAVGARFGCGGDEGPREALRAAIDAATRAPEPEALAPLLALAELEPAQGAEAQALAERLVEGVRGARMSWAQALVQTYPLSSPQGVALMGLAEALLRIPDGATRDALLRDVLGRCRWRLPAGQAGSVAAWLASWCVELGAAAAGVKGARPLVRAAAQSAMRLLGQQFVRGQSIEEALERAQPLQARGFLYSYDMLGEAALTEADAQRYAAAYAHAIEAIGRSATGEGVHERPGISIKLSALHSRYGRAQRQRVLQELLPRVLELAAQAQRQGLGLNIDAEEAERLDVSLDVVQALCEAPQLRGWPGLGVVVQAYQKRAPAVIDWLVALARRTQRRLMVRLVKGAYWDAEIKRAQLDGVPDYPVWTRKAHTDVAYLACARQLLAAPEAVFPQFATHNALTVASVLQMALQERGPWRPGQYEFQCLHGMGEPLYAQLVGPGAAAGLRRACRIYAPVGAHDALLPYLVRRLLENGANSSFVHRVADRRLSPRALLTCPVQRTRAESAARGLPAGQPHPRIPKPPELWAAARRNSEGPDWAHEPTLQFLQRSMQEVKAPEVIFPMLAAAPEVAEVGVGSAVVPRLNPADAADVLGGVRHASAAEVEEALEAACAHVAEPRQGWSHQSPAQRAAVLERAAERLQAALPQAMALLVREAGKTWGHAAAEVREAVDFCRYHAAGARLLDGEACQPLGVVACISPWNFPLAIFVGQVTAALAAGNVVLAKPAEATPGVAAWAVAQLWAAGVPRAALQLLPGTGPEVGQQLVADGRVQGVMFTGSTETARRIQATLAERLNAHGHAVPLVAETGGQNAMIVDSSALLEQVALDAVDSAFGAAGQRCSALRVLCVQEEVADRLLALVRGAMAELRVGPPARYSTDVGPVIDARAAERIEAHVQAMAQRGYAVHRIAHATSVPPCAAAGGRGEPADAATPRGHYVWPTLIELPRVGELTHEVFGPVLHVVRYRREALPQLLAELNATGYALTLGIASRIEATVQQVIDATHAGNVYVNRGMVGAVVGVQPFGGEGLSGTGPKAGGPLSLLHLLARCPADAPLRALRTAGHAERQAAPDEALLALAQWARAQGREALVQQCERAAALSPAPWDATLPGVTGEHNRYLVRGRRRVWCVVEHDAGAGVEASQADALAQLAAVLAVGARAVWPARCARWRAQMPPAVQARVELLPASASGGTDACRSGGADAAAVQPPPRTEDPWADVDLALCHGSAALRLRVARALAQRPGAIVPLVALAPGEEVPLHRLVRERTVCTNTAAAGGNASLLALAE